MPRAGRRLVRPRKGLALVTAMGALVLVSVIIAGVFTLTDNESKSSTNRAAALRATQLTEAGLAHTLALLRTSTLLSDTSFSRLLTGFDNTVSTSDDGYLTGYSGLTSTLEITAAGVVTSQGTYYVQIIDDPADTDGNALTDMNNRIVARCRGVTTDGASAEIDAIIGPQPMPAVAVDGSLTLNGNPSLLGPCGGAHANTTVSVSGTTTVTTAGLLTSTGSTSVSGTIEDTSGTSIPPVPNQPPIDIPTINPLTYCTTTNLDYDMQADGYILRLSDNTLHNASVSGGVFGFRFFSSGNGEYRGQGTDPPDGKYCVRSNLQINGMGTDADPVRITFYVTGSVDVGGNPKIVRADSARNILLVAAGDVQMSGTSSGGGASLGGLIYAGAQCSAMGTTAINGQLVCKNGSNPTGSNALVSSSQVGGNTIITFDCSGSSILGNRRVLYWYPRIGS
jgi:Tfp pilus assembly protein PilX